MDWNAIWQDIKDFFTGNGWAILGFFVTLIVGFIIVKLLIKLCRKLLSKTKLERIAQKFIISIIKVALYLIWILILLSELGISITGIVAALSAAILAIGLALQDSLSNLANGIIIVSGKFFKEGDYININGVEGTVRNINLLSTTILTVDNKAITIPNSQIVNNPMTNYNREKLRRVDLSFDVAYETDIEKAKSIILKVVESDGRIYLEPKPFVALKALNESSIKIVVQVWADGEDYWDVYYYLVDKIFNELKKNKISIPFNQVEVRLRNDKVKIPFNTAPLPKRVEKVREPEKKPNLFEKSIESLKHHKKNEKKAEKQLKKLEKENKKLEKEKLNKTKKVDKITDENNKEKEKPTSKQSKKPKENKKWNIKS